ncbi:DUF4129 domain-containing protein [Demequina activiva]|uniref:Protein-glutamine gamma-glutamyltransferase-like C-terminal domain-containing protein n=1 Tax=Demequina activiva TaxID=1582364 RepID=A0A919Q734_9MICO|nr:DUF4129 domain-containing protein [Demequina activiva]GIG55398.1 hypothetical protein Dac01nite_21500 [Demequina activiva]
MLLDVPVDPDADTAREWAVDELAKPEYREGSGFSLDALWDWLGDLFDRIGDAGGSLGIPGALVVGLIVAAALALITWLVLGPLRRSRQGASAGAVFDDDSRPWRQIRDSARDAQSRGDWDLAVVEWFRAAVRLELERGAILDSPGVTAHEAALRVGDAVPRARAEISMDADAFDRARYGAGGLSEAQARHAEATFTAVESYRRTEAAPS